MDKTGRQTEKQDAQLAAGAKVEPDAIQTAVLG